MLTRQGERRLQGLGAGAPGPALLYAAKALTVLTTARSAALVGALALTALAAGCGGGGDSGSDPPPPVAQPRDFPKPAGRTLVDLRRMLPGAGPGPVLATAVSELEPGTNRFGFGLFDRARSQLAEAKVAVYAAPVGGGPARGPFPARYESLATDPEFRSAGVEKDKDAAKSVYTADLRFRKPGRYEVLGVVRLDDRLVLATPAGGPLKVVADGEVPEVGERAPKISTPTKASVSGNVESIDTRVPPSTMHDEDFADVVGKKPAVLLFATPALCQSRVCGPVVDIAEQVKARGPKGAAFIHQEIYRDNEVSKGLRPQVVKWNLQSEPWLFVVDRRGRIAARIEGPFSARELERALDAVAG